MEITDVLKKALGVKVTLALFSFLGLWFTLSSFGVPTYGDFISWLMVFAGCWMMIATKRWSSNDIVLLFTWVGFFAALIGGVNLFSSFLTVFISIGNIWHWLIFLYSLAVTLMNFFKVSTSRFCLCNYFSQWFFMILMVVGAWFVLHDLVGLPTFGIQLIHLITFLIPLGLLIHQETKGDSEIHITSSQTPATEHRAKNDDESFN